MTRTSETSMKGSTHESSRRHANRDGNMSLMQAGLVEHHDVHPRDREFRKTANTARSHPSRPSASMLIVRAVQSETAPPLMTTVMRLTIPTGQAVDYSFLFLREHASIPMVFGGRVRSRNHAKQPHTASEGKPCQQCIALSHAR